jgi:protein TonB
MEPTAILQTDPLDLLFEIRNKAYGAYTLRKYYSKRLYSALAITMSSVVLYALGFIYLQPPPVMTRIFTIPDTIIDPPPVAPPEKTPVHPPSRPRAPKPPGMSTISTPVIVAGPVDLKPLPPISNPTGNSAGLKAGSGDGVPGERGNTDPSPSGTGITNSEPVENKAEIFDRPEVMPEFPGGMAGLRRFLLKNLVVPEGSLDPGAEVWVVARFVVSADGRVRNIEIIRPSMDAFNTEVKRVIAKMPVWKPGSQNHRNVAVYFSLPVHFIVAEDR